MAKAKTITFDRTILYSAIRIWNGLPDTVIEKLPGTAFSLLNSGWALALNISWVFSCTHPQGWQAIIALHFYPER